MAFALTSAAPKSHQQLLEKTKEQNDTMQVERDNHENILSQTSERERVSADPGRSRDASGFLYGGDHHIRTLLQMSMHCTSVGSKPL